MKIYKLLLLTVLSYLALSCSQDKDRIEQHDGFNERLSAGQFDNSYLGVYKGLFSTNDGLTRGSIVLTLSPNSIGIAQITLSSGDVIDLQSRTPKLTVDNRVSDLIFTSSGLNDIETSFKFSVEGNGLNPDIREVSFNNQDSDVLVAKDLSRAPLNTITGTYMRTDGTGGFPTSGRTWNVMSIGMDNQTYAAQIWYGGRLYNTPPTGTQDNCVDNGNFTDTCDISGSTNILGHLVTWSGTHTYDNFDDNLGCSEVSGTWSAPTYGGSSGTFQSDSDCSGIEVINDVCANASLITCGDSVVGNSEFATNADSPLSCSDDVFGSDDVPGVWYKFISTECQEVTVSTLGSDYDTHLKVFSGSCGALDCVANNDDIDFPDFPESELTFTASEGETYYFFIGGYEGDTGDYALSVTCGTPTYTSTTNPACGQEITDNGGGNGNYSNNRNDVYNIDAGEGMTANLVFNNGVNGFALESGFDFMRIYDGEDICSPMITATTDGTTATPDGFTGTSLRGKTVVSTGRYLTVVFESDISVVDRGFRATVNCVTGRQNSGQQKNSLSYMPAVNENITPKVPNTSSRISIWTEKSKAAYYQNNK
ncbi:CUB domain-containing protein [Subsaxibacter sp. CAU 1640]|uniref:CUB domain-containing protein n=1 Tax=Subsaxibacter sp. CAU 1640 TaxID=2933271 RepID=UPI002002DCE0|nr:CUB domain-containing protein [Subsaxibacter sp. CAU 1640]MCK7590875.1 CUB domain-containing protein [Subsaxibacter sp. CAU 1640]